MEDEEMEVPKRNEDSMETKKRLEGKRKEDAKENENGKSAKTILTRNLVLPAREAQVAASLRTAATGLALDRGLIGRRELGQAK